MPHGRQTDGTADNPPHAQTEREDGSHADNAGADGRTAPQARRTQGREKH